jgi:hypothetical protein
MKLLFVAVLAIVVRVVHACEDVFGTSYCAEACLVSPLSRALIFSGPVLNLTCLAKLPILSVVHAEEPFVCVGKMENITAVEFVAERCPETQLRKYHSIPKFI